MFITIGITAIAAPLILTRMLYYPYSYRIEFYIATTGKEVIIFGDDYAFKPILPEVALVVIHLLIILGIGEVNPYGNPDGFILKEFFPFL